MKRDQSEKQRDLAERTFDFAVSVIRFLKTVQYSKENDVVRTQLVKSATSVGANYEEAQGAYSKEDFSYKISICFREAKESSYWLRIMKAADISISQDLDYLIQESNELRNIFGSISKKVHYRNDLRKQG